MIWFFYALLGAFFDATYTALVKKYLRDINLYVLSAGVFLFSFVILFLISVMKGIPTIGPLFLSSVLATAALNVVAVIFYLKALKMTDLSLAVPMISFTPVFLIFTSFILLNEFPTAQGIAGIFLIVIGSYILNLNLNLNQPASWSGPVKEMLRNRGLLYMLLVAFLFSFTANFDKMVVQNSDAIFGTSLVCLLLGLSFGVISLTQKRENLITAYRKSLPKFFLLALILGLTAITINIALTLQIVPYVISIKRLSIVFSLIYGVLIFKEKNILPRAIGALIMVGGVILIVV